MALERDRLRPNPRAAVSAVSIGPEPHQSALVIDDFFIDPQYVRSLALSLDYRKGRGTYPGYEARISIAPDSILERVLPLIDPRLRVAPPYRDVLVFSMMHEGSDPKLRHYPHPHADHGITSESACIAAIVFLNPPEQCRGGTAFYRHRETGLCESRGEITEGLAAFMLKHQLASVQDALALIEQADLPEDPEGEWGYITESNDLWEKLALVEMRWNRLVVFDGLLFHNPYLRSGDFGRSAEQRRLTLNTFFELPW